MKIAIATIKKNEDSEISLRAARAPFYLIFDEKGELLETISNPFVFGSGGAGFGVAKMLADKGVDTIIAGAFGPNMISAMEGRGLKCQKKEGRAKKILKEVI